MRRTLWWDDEDSYSPIEGFGSVHDLRDAEAGDPRNPRLAGLKSASYAAAVAMRRPDPKPATPRRIGFDTRAHLKRR